MSGSAAIARPGESGFTLLEAMIALGIFALAMTFVVPLANRSHAGLQLRSTAHDIAADLRSARASAQRSNVEQALVINVQDHEMWTQASSPRRSIPRRFGVAMEIPDAERLGVSVGVIRFFPDGSASGGRIHLSEGGRIATVSVNWLNGDVRVHWNR